MIIIARPDGLVIRTTRTGAWVSTTAEGFTSKHDALAWQMEFADSFPVWGYGTSFHLSENKDAGTYTVTAKRYPSCD